ncbi:MAG: hypothetical protein ABIF77_16965, partial [bacterium]
MNTRNSCPDREERAPGRFLVPFSEFVVLAVVLFLLCTPWLARAQVSTVSNITGLTSQMMEEIGSVQPGALTSDTDIRLFLEQGDVLLAAPLAVDITQDGTYGTPLSPGVIPAGEIVTSVAIHADRASPTGVSNLQGSVEFNAEILGVIVGDARLDASDGVLGLELVLYPTAVTERGLELGALFHRDEIVVAGNRVELDLVVDNVPDQIRVILLGSGGGVSFSIDCQGPTHGAAPAWGAAAITAGDVLTPGAGGAPGPNRPVFGPTIRPGVMLTPADLGITSPGVSGVFEVDALSFGNDRGGRVRFSVDEFANGAAGYTAPDVRSEGAAGNLEASADVFAYRGPLRPTLPSFAPGNRAILDGDGVAPSGRPGFGLEEDNPPTWKQLPDDGDNLDALDLGTRPADLEGYVFFFLDASFSDRTEIMPPGTPPNYATAAANLVSAADVLVKYQSSLTSMRVYAHADTDLGLDPAGDDIDALMIYDDGDGEYNSNVDKIHFSLRRDSASLGTICPLTGLEISEADILAPGPVIIIPGESLGLNTRTSGDVMDDLCALDRIPSRRAPVGQDDQVEVEPDMPSVIPCLVNDFPLDGNLVPSRVVIFDPPELGVITHIDPVTGDIGYRYDGDKSGSADSFTYIVFDDNGECSEPTTVSIAVATLADVEDLALQSSLFSFADPNPFSGGTTFMLRPIASGPATVVVYDLMGRRIRTLLDESLVAGEVRLLAWDGNDELSRSTAAGVYLVRMRSVGQERRLR